MTLTFVGIGVSLLLSVAFTLLAVTIEVWFKLRKGSEARTRWRTKACFTRSFWLYFVLLTVFNGVGTLLALTLVPMLYPEFFEELGVLLYFISAI